MQAWLMQNRCCVYGCFLNKSNIAHADELKLKWFCATLFHGGHLLFTWKTHCGLKFYFGQIDRSEICIEVSFTSSELIWTLIIKLPYTEVKFYPKVKSKTDLISLQVSGKRALNLLSTKSKYWRRLLSGNMGLENNDNLSA